MLAAMSPSSRIVLACLFAAGVAVSACSSDGGDSADAGGTTDDMGTTDDGSDDTSIPWGEDESVACDVEAQDLGSYTEPEVDPGYPGQDPVGQSCAAGYEPEPRVECDGALCWCQPICEPGCGNLEVCGGDACECHPSYSGSAGACTWSSIVANESFGSCDGWTFVGGGDDPAARLAELKGERLHLAVTSPCNMVAAQTVARLPDAAELGGGAALVFDASAKDGTDPFVMIDGVRNDLTLSVEPSTQRVCVPLGSPKLVNLAFAIEAYGLCEDTIDTAFWVDQVRLEADATCG